MDYPKLHQKLEKEMTSLEKAIVSARTRYDEALRILAKHEVLAHMKAKSVEPLKQALDEAEKGKEVLSMKRSELEVFGDSNEVSGAVFQDILGIDNQIAGVENEIRSIRPKLEKALGILTRHRENAESQKTAASDLETFVERLEEGKENLQKELVKLSKISALGDQSRNPDLIRHFRFTQEKIVRPNSKFTTFEALFTPPAYRIVPKPEGLYGSVDWKNLPLEACVADPALIPDWFAEELGLAELPSDLGEVEILRRKAEAIPQLKSLFVTADPLERYSKNGMKVDNFRLMSIAGFNPGHDGKILYTRYSGRDSESKDSKIIQVFDDAYDALRMAGHKDSRYGYELPQVTGARNRLKAIQSELLSIRKDDPDAQERESAIRQKLAEEIRGLNGVTNFNKRSALESLGKMATLDDRLGRKNVGAARARMVSIVRNIEARLPQIFNKSMFGQEDRKTLESAVVEAEQLLTQYAAAFDIVLVTLDKNFIRATAVFNGSPEKDLGCQKENLANSLMTPFQSLTSLVAIPPVRPFTLYAQAIENRKWGILQGINQRDHPKTLHEAGLARASLGLFEIQKTVERLTSDLSLNREFNLISLSRRNAELLQAIGGQSQSLGIQMLRAKCPEVIDLIAKQLDQFKKLSAEALAKIPALEPGEEVRGELKVILREIDFPEYLRMLSKPTLQVVR